MAIKTIPEFSGRIGNLIVYKWKNKTCLRTMPSRVRQTKQTKLTSLHFGKAAAISRLIREALKDVLPDYKEAKMRYRLNNEIYQWLKLKESNNASTDIPFLDGFSFTDHISYNNLAKKIDVDWGGKARIHFPEMEIAAELSAPKKTYKVMLGFHLIGCNIQNTELKCLMSKIIEIEYPGSISANSFEWEIHDNNSIFIVVLSVKYKAITNREGQVLKDAPWMQVEVVASYYNH